MLRSIRDIPTRLATGAFILNSGWGKWNGSPEQAAGVHGMAAAAFPVLADVPPQKFLKGLAASEIGLGAALLSPFIPRRLAGLGLTAFAGSLLALYWRTPALHQPGSIRPTQAGTAISKDVWMLGIGVGLLVGSNKPKADS